MDVQEAPGRSEYHRVDFVLPVTELERKVHGLAILGESRKGQDDTKRRNRRKDNASSKTAAPVGDIFASPYLPLTMGPTSAPPRICTW
ncbi:MAG: hypothetical protein RL477_1036 [Pseudomonadota bacterium]